MGNRRYGTLDALRGVAAMAVVLFHLGEIRMEPALVPHGYLAVDFFFVLSGFVVAHAYEGALQDWLSWRVFLVKRLIRLYPLALLGAAIGLLVLVLKWFSFPGKVDPLPRILISGLLNGLMLPTFFGSEASRSELFPGNGPLWTLFFEMGANMLWAWLGIRMRTWALAVVALTSWSVLAVLATQFHTVNIGFDVTTFWGGFARVCFGFPLGVVIYRLRSFVGVPSTRAGPLLLGLALVIVLALPVGFLFHGIPGYDLVCILIVLPAIVVLGIEQGATGHLGAELGSLSYPVYVLHFPVLMIASGLHQSMFPGSNVHVFSILSFVIVLLVGRTALHIYDEPARGGLSRAAAGLSMFRSFRSTIVIATNNKLAASNEV